MTILAASNVMLPSKWYDNQQQMLARPLARRDRSREEDDYRRKSARREGSEK